MQEAEEERRGLASPVRYPLTVLHLPDAAPDAAPDTVEFVA
jgi:hypothetical protein